MTRSLLSLATLAAVACLGLCSGLLTYAHRMLRDGADWLFAAACKSAVVKGELLASMEAGTLVAPREYMRRLMQRRAPRIEATWRSVPSV